MTIYNAPRSILTNVETYLSVNRNVKFPDRLQPRESVQWAVENKRSLTGFITTDSLRVSDVGDIYVKTNTLVLEDTPAQYSANVDIEDGKVSVTIQYEQVEELSILRETDDPLFTEVDEITFTE